MKSSGTEYGLLERKRNDKREMTNTRTMSNAIKVAAIFTSNDNELSEKIYQAAAHNRCSVGNSSTTRVVTVSCRQPYLPSAVQVAWVVSGETRTEDDAAHFRQHPPTGS